MNFNLIPTGKLATGYTKLQGHGKITFTLHTANDQNNNWIANVFVIQANQKHLWTDSVFPALLANV